jgi:hypothetical protein
MKLVETQSEQSYSLSLYELFDEQGDLLTRIPVVNDWIQLSIELNALPEHSEQLDFFDSLRQMVDSRQSRSLFDAWYFLHKPPGLLLRFHKIASAKPPEMLIDHIVSALTQWDFKWMGDCYFDSYLEQRELLSGFDQAYVNRLLTASADTFLDACLRDTTSGKAGAHKQRITAWVDFVCQFLHFYIEDQWQAWEALKRFATMRKQLIKQSGQQAAIPSAPLYNPVSLINNLKQLDYIPKQGFEVSTSLLQCLNYLFNQWALDLPVQNQILAQAMVTLRPEIAGNE